MIKNNRSSWLKYIAGGFIELLVTDDPYSQVKQYYSLNHVQNPCIVDTHGSVFGGDFTESSAL